EQVHQDHIPVQTMGDAHRLGTVGGLAHHLELWIDAQADAEALAHHLVVVSDQDAYSRGGSGTGSGCGRVHACLPSFQRQVWATSGKRARKSVPSPGALWISSVPPTAAARSRIDWSPRCPGKSRRGSNPRPSSATTSPTSASPNSSKRSSVWARACLTVLCIASCATRYSASLAPWGRSGSPP